MFEPIHSFNKYFLSILCLESFGLSNQEREICINSQPPRAGLYQQPEHGGIQESLIYFPRICFSPSQQWLLLLSLGPLILLLLSPPQSSGTWLLFLQSLLQSPVQIDYLPPQNLPVLKAQGSNWLSSYQLPPSVPINSIQEYSHVLAWRTQL